LRPYVKLLGSQLGKNALNKQEMLHQDVYKRLVKVYNDESQEDLKTLPHTHEMYAKWDLKPDVPSSFDILDARDISDIMAYLYYHLKDRLRDCNKLGSHDVFQNYVQTKPYLFVYYQSL
jgi:hypothetical protein